MASGLSADEWDRLAYRIWVALRGLKESGATHLAWLAMSKDGGTDRAVCRRAAEEAVREVLVIRAERSRRQEAEAR